MLWDGNHSERRETQTEIFSEKTGFRKHLYLSEKQKNIPFTCEIKIVFNVTIRKLSQLVRFLSRDVVFQNGRSEEFQRSSAMFFF